MGLEPTTLGLEVLRAIQLRHRSLYFNQKITLLNNKKMNKIKKIDKNILNYIQTDNKGLKHLNLSGNGIKIII